MTTLSKDALDLLIAGHSVNGDLYLINYLGGESPIAQNGGTGEQFFRLAGTRARYAIDELLGAGLVRQQSEVYYVLTPAGRDLAQAQTADNVAARSAAEQEIDGVAGIGNRQYVESESRKLLQKCRAAGIPCAALLIDTDNFKAFNTRYGHPVGDKVLRAVAQIAAQAILLRGGVVGRWGAGDEIVATMSNLTLPEIVALGERIRLAVKAAPVEGLAVTVSIGVTSAIALASVEDLWDLADKALNEAKQLGKDRVASRSETP